MKPERKGQLLIQYVHAEKATGTEASRSPQLDFRRAVVPAGSEMNDAKITWSDLRKATLQNVKLNGADLFATDLSGASLTRSQLRGASLVSTKLIEADLSETLLDGADLSEADLSNAILIRARLDSSNFERANLTGANLTDAVANHANFKDSILRDVDLSTVSLRGAVVNAQTYVCSGWTPRALAAIHMAGVEIHALDQFPAEAQRAVLGSDVGLMLYFNNRLTRFERYIVDGIIFGVLGRDTDCRVVEFREQGEAAVVRLQAGRPEDLELVAEVLYRRAWEQHEQAASGTSHLTAAVGGNVEGSVLVVGSGNIVIAGSEAASRLGDVMAIQKLRAELARLRDDLRRMELWATATAEGKPAEVVRTWEGDPDKKK